MKSGYAKFIKSAILAMASLYISLTSSYAQQAEKAANSANDWLNGKWSGPAIAGGELQLELKVVNEKEITGQSRIQLPGKKRDIVRPVTGTVEGDQVRIELLQKGSENTQKWNFVRKDGNLSAIRKGDEFVFKKSE